MFYRPGTQPLVTRAVSRALNRGSQRATSSAFRRLRNKHVVLESIARPLMIAGMPSLMEAAYMTEVKMMFTAFEEEDDGT